MLDATASVMVPLTDSSTDDIDTAVGYGASMATTLHIGDCQPDRFRVDRALALAAHTVTELLLGDRMAT